MAEEPEPKEGSISNEYIKFNYIDGAYGIITTEGDPDNPKDDNQRLLYGDGHSSFTAIRIDEESHRFEKVDSVKRYGNKVIVTKRYGDIIVAQHISIVANPYTNRDDLVETFYTVENTSDTPHTVGVRILFDVVSGNNDLVPFKIPG
ncbi:hypothetical protein [Defluviitalea raffinosedens]|uniref:hypothetical protein n=1 Tax=Defluviitalea raffinosedens TaxID=1450156 RepID=UPI001959F537|nr:hypothetical protein [Defluviitalea raffinosedens]MBM7685886.1 hypothetical protein [Defluviitalea raffinosedens]